MVVGCSPTMTTVGLISADFGATIMNPAWYVPPATTGYNRAMLRKSNADW